MFAVNPKSVSIVPETAAITTLDVVENIAKEALTMAAVTPDIPAPFMALTTAAKDAPVIEIVLIEKVPDTDNGFCTEPFTVG